MEQMPSSLPGDRSSEDGPPDTVHNVVADDTVTDDTLYRSRVLFRIVLAAIALGYLPTLYYHTTSVWRRTYYQFVPILMVACGFLAWQTLRQNKESTVLPMRRLETGLMAVAVLLLLAGVILFIPWIGTLSAIIAIGSLLLHLGGRRKFQALLPVWMLLLLILPPPFGYDIQLVAALQSYTTVQASYLLDYLSIDHMMSGNVLEFPGQRLMVEEACSGVQSLFALFAYAALFIVWKKIPWYRALALLASSVFWAGVLNIVRVIAIAWMISHYNIDLSTGWRHEMLGVVIFVIALLMLASTDEMLQVIFRSLSFPTTMLLSQFPLFHRTRFQLERRRRRRSEIEYPIRQPGNWTIWQSPICATLFLLIGVFQFGLLFSTKKAPPVVVETENAESLLPETLGSWKKDNYDVKVRGASSIHGKYSNTWTFQTETYPLTVSLDYPFSSWHDLRQCYKAQGWTILGTNQKTTQLMAAGDPEQILEVSLNRADGRHGYLLFGEFNQLGEPVNPVIRSDNETSFLQFLAHGLKDRWRKSLSDFGSPQQIYQMQFMVVSDVELSAAEREKIRDQYKSTLMTVHSKTTQQEG